MPVSAANADLLQRFGVHALTPQQTLDDVATFWTDLTHLKDVLRFARTEANPRYRMLFDLTAIDERLRRHRDTQPASDFTVVYHLMALERGAALRLKVPLHGELPQIPTVTDLWPNADWYEREVWDFFGITFIGHPRLRRILRSTIGCSCARSSGSQTSIATISSTRSIAA